MSVCEFTFLSLITLHTTNYDKNCCNISIVLNINLLQYKGNVAIHVHYVASHLAQRPKLFFFFFWLIQRPKLKRSNGFSSSFIQKLKVFNISNASVSSHVESLGNFKKKYKVKKEKVRNHIHNSVRQKKKCIKSFTEQWRLEMDREEECSTKKKEVLIHYRVVETDREEADSWRHPYSVVVFFLFSFFSVFFPYK